MPRAGDKSCTHSPTTRSQTPGSPYEACLDCGAVRLVLSKDPWHICELCLVPGPYEEEAQ